MMQKLGFPSKNGLDRFKSLSASVSGTAKAFSFAPRPSSDSTSSGSFANLKLTAEKLVKEQASVKADLEMANNKLKKSTEHIRELEEKLQNAFNENAKLKVKQKEDEKLWNGLESKFSSTKTLCDQLTETLQQLANQVHEAEKDKEYFESKLSANETALDDLNQQMNGLSLKLESAGETIRKREQELEELKIEKEDRDKVYRDERCRTTILMEEKDALIKNFETTVTTSRLNIESLNSKLDELKTDLKLKEDQITELLTIKEKLDREKSDMELLKDDFSKRVDISLLEIKKLEAFIHILGSLVAEVDKQSLIYLDKSNQLSSLNESCFKLLKQEKDLASKHAQRQYDQLHDRFFHVTSEKDTLQLINGELNNKVTELERARESITAQLSEEGQIARERIQKLESEAEILVSKKNETEMLICKLQAQFDALSERLRSSDNTMQDLLLKISALETENEHNAEKFREELKIKIEEIDTLQKESELRSNQIDSVEKQAEQLRKILEEKDELIVQSKERETKLEGKIAENQELLTAAESRLAEATKQYDLMLENKQLDLSRHLKDLSHRNDQAINDIRNKYEAEKLDIVNTEKERAKEIIGEMEAKCDQKIAENKEESRKYLIRVQEEHASLVSRIQQEYARKEQDLKTKHGEELKGSQLQSENELKEKMMILRGEHEAQMRALRSQHEDECIKLQDELDLQKTKEDQQRALLQLQWKVMGDKLQEDQEVNSKKDYSISSVHVRNSSGPKRSQHTLIRPDDQEKFQDSPYVRASQTPVTKLLKKVENASTGSVLSIPKHHKKVTHHEYEVETSNGRTITKRKRTKSTVMFEDPRKHKKMTTPKANTPRSVVKALKKGDHQNPSNIGDLFREGSLDPYADDPYAFD